MKEFGNRGGSPPSPPAILARKLRTLARSPRTSVMSKFMPWREKRARAYLKAAGVCALLRPGNASEFAPEAVDLALLHRTVREHRPARILEFGSGYSTIVMAHALRMNGGGKLYAVDASEAWLANTAGKLPPELKEHVELTYSPCSVTLFNGRLCHLFERLPNIAPNLVYVDGPAARDVAGDVHGLAFNGKNEHERRAPVSADLLLYESTLPDGCIVVIDTRMTNTSFLLNNLQRRWRHRYDLGNKSHVLTLRDWPKR